MLINHPNGRGKTFVATSEEPTKLSVEEIKDVVTQLDEIMDQSFVHVAIFVADSFPDSEVYARGSEKEIEFTFFHENKLLLTVDEVGWKIEGQERSHKWTDIIEGTPQSVAENILQNFADRDFLVYHAIVSGNKRKINKRNFKKRI